MYLSSAKKALEILGKAPAECGSYEELLALLRANLAENKLPKALRIAPFLAFLESKITTNTVEIPDLGPVRSWVMDGIEEQTKATREASHFIRRDLAMLACLCAAPGQGSVRSWPKTALSVTRQGGGYLVKLWDKPVEPPGLALALLYWHTWRERLDRPAQSRLHRKAWAYSALLFPNSKGEALTKHAMRNAVSRLSVAGEGRVRLTAGLIRRAFLQLEA